MKEITVKVFKFDELSDKAKEKARDWFRTDVLNNDGSDWSEFTIEEAVREGNLLGIDFDERQVRLMGGGTRGEPKIWWSGFSSQGDGACYEGTWRAWQVKADEVANGWGEDPATTEIKRIAAALAEIAKEYPGATARSSHHDRYYHERSVSFDFGAGEIDPDHAALEKHKRPEDGDDVVERARERWEEALPTEDIAEALRDFMRWIYRQLEKENEYRYSDEAVDESIEANEYDFNEDGSRSTVS